MGLMAEVPWGLSSSGCGQHPTTDFHHDNIKTIRRLSAKARHAKSQSGQAESARPRPVRAFALPDHQENQRTKQSRVDEWTDAGADDPQGPRSRYGQSDGRVQQWSEEGDSKRFLLGHEKTGPFVPSSAASVTSGYRKLRPAERSPRDAYDGVHSEIQAAMTSYGSRFSEVSIEERKLKIQRLVSDIYSVEPLCKQHLTRHTIEKNLRKFASSDQISDAGSICAGSVRSSHQTSVNVRLGRAASSNRINVCNVEPLTRAQLQKHNQKHTGHLERDYSSKTESQISPVLHPVELRSRISSRASSLPRFCDRSQSPEPPRSVSRASRLSRSETPNGQEDEADRGSVMARGIDVDYVSANIEGVSAIGHNRRKEVKAVKEALNVKRPSLALPETYRTGSVPKYLQDRQTKWKEEAERKEREKPDPDCPPNHVRLDDASRLDALTAMKSDYQELLSELSRFSVRADTIRIRQRKRDIEDEMTHLEAKIKVYERPKVFVPKL